jgi:hypothetical protein
VADTKAIAESQSVVKKRHGQLVRFGGDAAVGPNRVYWGATRGSAQNW